MPAIALFLDFSRSKLLGQYWPRMRSCVTSLTDEQVWWRPNPSSNSVGNLLLHLNGNVRQWLVSSFNHGQDHRDRPAEFNATEQLPVEVLIERMSETMREAEIVLNRLTAEELLASHEIQGYETTGLAAIYQVVEHFALHYGQIVYITKMFLDKDLGFYRELNHTGRPPDRSKHKY